MDFYLVISFEIEFYACDLTLVNRDLALIVIEDNNINDIYNMHVDFFILSSYDIIKSERQDYDDYIEFLINKKEQFHDVEMKITVVPEAVLVVLMTAVVLHWLVDEQLVVFVAVPTEGVRPGVLGLPRSKNLT
ncbi:unnamed protein product [Rotaria magnacalcarata]|uniref:Uncharacterized protein n=1 Tax=Rotaria magnacalcarata TaxID=392030 RepID=A0A819HZW3_9BILA|nr:unnamed protein product [Rotaria magnacalcarata]